MYEHIVELLIKVKQVCLILDSWGKSAALKVYY